MDQCYFDKKDRVAQNACPVLFFCDYFLSCPVILVSRDNKVAHS